MRALLPVILSILTVVCPAQAIDKADVQRIVSLYEKAIELRDQGKAEEAEKVARQGLAQFPESEDLMLILADILNRTGRSTEAVRYYKSALAKQPNAASILSALCSAEVNTGEYKEAVNHCERAEKIDKKDGTVWYNLGRSYAALGDYTKARLNYQKYVKEFGDETPDDAYVIQARSEVARLSTIIENRTAHGAAVTEAREKFTSQEEALIRDIVRRYTKLGMSQAEAETTVNGMREAWMSIPKAQREITIKQMQSGLPE